MIPLAADPSTELIDTAVTLEAELSPRKLDLIGVKGIIEILAEAGKVTRRGPKAGEPLSMGAVYRLTVMNPTFPKPWIDDPGRPLWRRADVVKWAPTWSQKDGPQKGSRRVDLLVTVIDGEPDRVWTVHDLMAAARRNKVFGEATDLRRAVFRTLDTAIKQGQIKRLKPGAYQSLHGSSANGAGREDG